VTDDQGRALILHGVNVSGHSKGESGLPPAWFDAAHAMRLSRQWGFNHVRYLIFWARIEEDGPGLYEEAYLDAVEERLDGLAAAGIHVILDMHQDVWGPFAGDPQRNEGSDGAPAWATITDGQPFIDFAGLFGSWSLNYLSPDVMRAWDNFWDHSLHPELQDAYAAMWAHVAVRFREHPAVLGYDIMNEPWQGSDLLNEASFDQTAYFDFNQRVIDAIRAVDEESWIFFEPRALACNQGGASHVPALHDPRPGVPRIGAYPHLYPLLVQLLGAWVPELDHAIEQWAGNRREEALRQRGPTLVGEWRMQGTSPDENRFAWMNEALSMMEETTSGWAYWAHNPGDTMNEDLTEKPMMDVLVRTYARAVAGLPLAHAYDPETRVFDLRFQPEPCIEAPTEIYVPASRHYPEGWSLRVEAPAGSHETAWDPESEVLSLWTHAAGTPVRVTVAPSLPGDPAP